MENGMNCAEQRDIKVPRMMISRLLQFLVGSCISGCLPRWSSQGLQIITANTFNILVRSLYFSSLLFATVASNYSNALASPNKQVLFRHQNLRDNEKQKNNL